MHLWKMHPSWHKNFHKKKKNLDSSKLMSPRLRWSVPCASLSSDAKRKFWSSSLALAQEGTKPFAPFHPVRPVAERVRLGLGKYKSEGKVLNNWSEHFHHIVLLFLNFSVPSLVLILIDSYSQVVVHFWGCGAKQRDRANSGIIGRWWQESIGIYIFISTFHAFPIPSTGCRAEGVR